MSEEREKKPHPIEAAAMRAFKDLTEIPAVVRSTSTVIVDGALYMLTMRKIDTEAG